MDYDMEKAHVEHQAWLDTNPEVKALGFEGWDDPKLKKLHARIVLWGERLAELRREQDAHTIQKALNEAARKVALS